MQHKVQPNPVGRYTHTEWKARESAAECLNSLADAVARMKDEGASDGTLDSYYLNFYHLEVALEDLGILARDRMAQ